MAEKHLIEMDGIRRFIKYHRWQFAKRYADFCPHEYVVMAWCKSDKDRSWFEEVESAIEGMGFSSKYGRLEERPYLIVDEYYYWIIHNGPNDPRECTVMNRAKLEDYIFWREHMLDGSILRCRYRRRNEPVQPREAVWEAIGPSPDGIRQGKNLRLL